jgi:hypothetical protein
MRRPFVVIGILLVLTWTGIGFDYYDRHSEPQQSTAVPGNPVLLGWGGPTPFCNAQVNGLRLVELRDKYAVAVVCGLPQDGVDRFEDKKITVSSLYTISAEPILSHTAYSVEMAQHVKGETEKFLKLNGMSEMPAGMTVNIPQWYEVVVLPKQTDISDIYRLSDVTRYGGKILSQEGYYQAKAFAHN